MGFWEREVSNTMDEMFDLNGDGMLDASEEALEYDYYNSDDDDDDDDDDEFDSDF